MNLMRHLISTCINLIWQHPNSNANKFTKPLLAMECYYNRVNKIIIFVQGSNIIINENERNRFDISRRLYNVSFIGTILPLVNPFILSL